MTNDNPTTKTTNMNTRAMATKDMTTAAISTMTAPRASEDVSELDPYAMAEQAADAFTLAFGDALLLAQAVCDSERPLPGAAPTLRRRSTDCLSGRISPSRPRDSDGRSTGYDPNPPSRCSRPPPRHLPPRRVPDLNSRPH